MTISLRSFAATTLILLISFAGFSQEAQINLSKYSFGKESIVVTIDGYDNFYLGNDYAEGSITEDPGTPGLYFTSYNPGVGRYTLNGHDWEESTINWGGYALRGNVVCASDHDGNIYFENKYGSPTVQGCVVIKSTDHGINWTTPVEAISGIDKNWLACDQTSGPYSNYIYTTMTASNGGRLARSTDQGASFNTMWTFEPQTLPGMMVCVGPQDDIDGGTIHVVTNSGDPFQSVYSFYCSKDGGETFEFLSSQSFAGYVGTDVGGRHSVNNMRTRPYPFITADNSQGPFRGRLYLVYASNNPPGNGNKPDIFCRYSDNDGESWSEAMTVNDDFPSTFHSQFHPIPWCGTETGILYIQWMDSRDTPTSDSALIYATYSADGGLTFKKNQAISNEKMPIDCITCPGGNTPRYQGDYNGIISNKEVSMLTWTDFRYGDFASFTSYFPDFAMKVHPAIDTIAGSAIYTMDIPDLKLYKGDVIFKAEVETPPAGYFTVLYPYDSILSILPGTLDIFITSSVDVPPGDYQVTFTGRGHNGTPVHKRYATVRVLAPYIPEADFTSDKNEVCEGEPINFYDLSQGSPTSWQWSFTGGYPSSSNEQNPEGIVYTVPGSYDISLNVSNTAGSDDTTKSDYISVSIIPVPPLTYDKECCFGGQQPYITASGMNISWYDDPLMSHIISTGDTLYVSESFPGTYEYFATQTINGCESNGKKATLTIHPLPGVSLAPFDSVCHGDPPFPLSGGLPEGGTYAGNGVANNIFDPFTAGPGTHQIQYIFVDTNGCANSIAQPLAVRPGPPVSLPLFNPVCLNDEAFKLTSGTPEGGTYHGDGVQDGWFYPSIAGEGEHMIRYTITDTSGCANAVERPLLVNALPEVVLEPFEPVCINQSTVLLSNGHPPGGIYEGAGIEGDYFNPGNAGLGTHQIIYIFSDENACTNSDTGYIDVKSITPLTPIPDTSICAGESVWLEATTPGIISYYWWPGGQTSPSVEIDSAGYGLGDHIFVVRGTNNNFCTTSDTVVVTIKDCALTSEFSVFEKVSFYPNPASELLVIEIYTKSPKDITVKIYNSLGITKHLFKEKDLDGYFIKDIDVKDFAPGIYYLTIECEQELISRKIIIK